MNLFPYNNAHLLVAPYAHVNGLEQLSTDTALDLAQLTNLCVSVLKATVHPDGFNVGLNLGRVSGAGIEEHLHWHIVPRWNGDTNFMPLFAETRVIPEHLRETYRKLKAQFRSTVSIKPTASTSRTKPANNRLPAGRTRAGTTLKGRI
jgi:ATP adenylyltransferase